MYSMSDGAKVARQATRDIETWLRSISQTLSVVNVEDDPLYQKVDVDLILNTKKGSYKIEIKGDRYHKTGNFFFETHSNQEKETPGCFLYTEADWIFYYFVIPGTLYLLPMPTTRDWFVANITRFPERATTTKTGNSFYTTLGRLVPIADVRTEVEKVQQFSLPN